MVESLPSWERGLKSMLQQHLDMQTPVAPLVGAWIEIEIYRIIGEEHSVAPLVGAWIEITKEWRKGDPKSVAPLVGAWIEI